MSAFIVGKKEGAVSQNGTANRCAKLSAIVRGCRLTVRHKEISRVQRAATHKTVRGSVQIVCAGMRNHVHLPGAVASERRVVGAGENFKRADRIDRWPNARRVELGIDVIDA